MFTPICKFLYIIYIFSKCESLNVTAYCGVHHSYKWDYFVHSTQIKLVLNLVDFQVFHISSEFITIVTPRYLLQDSSAVVSQILFISLFKKNVFYFISQKYTLSQSISYFIFTKIFQMNVLHTLSKKTVLLLSFPKKARVVQ